MLTWKTQLFAPAAVVVSGAALAVPAGYAATYLSVEQAQRTLFPGAALTPLGITLNAEQRRAIEGASDTRVRSAEQKIWRASGGGWFIVDEVLGKHEFITYAVALSATGAVKGVEILDYRESYGYEIRRPEWRQQFVGKTAGAPLKLDQDIKNISGATLSCRHVAEGVRRTLALYAAVLKG